jgi:hypothetical protein
VARLRAVVRRRAQRRAAPRRIGELFVDPSTREGRGTSPNRIRQRNADACVSIAGARTQADRWTARFESARVTAEIAREAIDLPRNWPTIPAEPNLPLWPPATAAPGSLGIVRNLTNRMADQAFKVRWTCSRCQVTVRWMPGYEQLARPSAWIEDGGEVYCLACRRALAAEAGVDAAPSGTTLQRRAQLRAAALIEFEVSRDPERSDSEIARAIRTSVPAVVKARQRLRAG